MSIFDRIKQFWSPAPPPDHPLDEEERLERERHPDSVYDEAAREIDDDLGADRDPV
jgi:hypothetical protein